MTKTPFDQKGFAGVIEVILVVIVVAVVSSAVVMSIRYRQQAAKVSESPTPTSVLPTKTISFTEWGVKAQYTSNSDLVYYPQAQNQPDVATLNLTTKQLAAKFENCRDYGAGFISRLSATAKAASVLPTDSEQTVEQFLGNGSSNAKRIGSYYYMFGHDQAACSENDTGHTEQSKANDLTLSIISHLEPIQ